ncbi:MAG: TrkH family potassium uptake protein [Oligoflexus sp.]
MAHIKRQWLVSLRPREIAFVLLLAPLFFVFASFLSAGTEEKQNFYYGLAFLIFLGAQVVFVSKNLGRVLIQVGMLSLLGIAIYQYWYRPDLIMVFAFVALLFSGFVHHIGRKPPRLKNIQDLETWGEELRYHLLLFYAALNSSIFILISKTPFAVSAVQVFTGAVSLVVFILVEKRISLSIRFQIFLQLVLVSLIPLFYKNLESETWEYFVTIMGSIPLLLFLFGSMRQRLGRDLTAVVEGMFRRPESAVVIFFALLSMLGTLALISPLSAAPESEISLIDAAFTAVSAVCVTGLIVLDTPHDFSLFGQACILALIQLGGLGIMALSSILLLFLKRRLSVSEEQALIEVMGRKSSISGALKQVLYVTFSFEAVGALLLSGLFMQAGDSFFQAMWRGLFTAISAFCNAGFALQSDSLMPYQNYPAILLIISILIIAGGLSPAFIVGLPRIFKDSRFSLQYRFVVYGNTALLVIGACLYLFLEWNASLMHLDFVDKLTNSWFQSVSARTAGFNSTDFSALNSSTSFVIMSLMFIGGSPGGTAGGIKTTTFMIMSYVLINMSRGLNQVTAFHRTITKRSIYQATTVVSCGLLIGYFGLTALLTTQRIDPLAALFEIVSASGTVGLSIGATQELNDIGKLIIMLVMFLGRIGSLAIVLFLGHQSDKGLWKYPTEDVSPV